MAWADVEEDCLKSLVDRILLCQNIIDADCITNKSEISFKVHKAGVMV